MGISSLIFVILAVLTSNALCQDHFVPSKNAILSVEVLPSLPSPFDSEPTAIVTVDCLFCSATDDEGVTFVTVEATTITTVDEITVVTHIEPSTTSGAASETIVCAPKCQTLVTVPWQSGESKVAPVAPYPVLTSCITIYNTPIPPSDILPLPTPSTWWSPASASSSCSTTSKNISPWTWPQPETLTTELASSANEVSPLASSGTEAATSIYRSTWTETEVYTSETNHKGVWSFEPEETSTEPPTTSTSTEEVPIPKPCTTEVTVTMTTTIVETWQSKTPQTATLLRTISTTIETIVVEAYSTSTGEVVVGGTTTETTTVEAVSSGVGCSEVGKCCKGCSATAESLGVETASSTVVQTYTTVEEYVSSAGGSWVPAESASGTIVPGTDEATATASETITISGSFSESEIAGSTAVQTAGAAHVTGAVGIGAIFGLMGLLA
ncbi:hypothetical protein FHETE_7617 [Fusarium heterosporum]|uniref:Uncharacterized protein n=1 Tax=Fusarium heterosporum TaxID=42747 RepID=A0A8H5T4W8_FUSHE|nr:hypothetical protein FHETE_7617 [Fusarium heterosporum]